MSNVTLKLCLTQILLHFTLCNIIFGLKQSFRFQCFLRVVCVGVEDYTLGPWHCSSNFKTPQPLSQHFHSTPLHWVVHILKTKFEDYLCSQIWHKLGLILKSRLLFPANKMINVNITKLSWIEYQDKLELFFGNWYFFFNFHKIYLQDQKWVSGYRTPATPP